MINVRPTKVRHGDQSDSGQRARRVEDDALIPFSALSDLQKNLLRLERQLIEHNQTRSRPLAGAAYYKWLAKRAGCAWREARSELEAAERALIRLARE